MPMRVADSNCLSGLVDAAAERCGLGGLPVDGEMSARPVVGAGLNLAYGARALPPRERGARTAARGNGRERPWIRVGQTDSPDRRPSRLH
jgi:hypothetical protein